jgi:general secretion pathway protein B
MSFILDALKKSEIERQRQAIPGLMDTPTAPPRPRFPLWAIALCALLALNAVVVAVVLIHGASKPGATTADLGAPAGVAAAPGDLGAAPAGAQRRANPAPPAANSAAVSPAGPTGAADTDAAPAPAAAAQSEPRHFSPMDPTPAYAPEIPPSGAAPTQVAPLAAPGRAHSGRGADEADAWRPPAHPADPILTHDDNPADSEVLPSISEVKLSGVPEMHIDVHVYAAKAADRFVYINRNRYQEGQTLAEGPVLERIRRDGVILDYRGMRFLLPRQ